jgi:hypothetical protein
MKILNSIKRLALVVFLFNALASQAQYIVTSTSGYEVNIELSFDSISVVNGTCSGGWYNYNLHYSYNISFTGTGAPSNLWTLQAYVIADDGNHFIPLPNGGGNANATSGSNVTRHQSDCNMATPSSLGCDSVHLVIQGPGIPYQTIYLNSSALPVELVSFDVKRINEVAAIHWTTATEENNDYFTIEESVDGEHFYSVREIQGAGNSSTLLNYSEEILLPKSDIIYYRLKQTDFDGQFSYSPIRTVTPVAPKTINAYPNPSTGPQFTVDLGDQSGAKQIRIQSASGQEVLTASTNNRYLMVDALPRGMYMIQVTNANGISEVFRFIQE